VYVAFDSMIIGMPFAIAVRYGRRPGASAVAEAPIVTGWLSVFSTAYPIPGKCFIEGSSAPWRRPVVKAFAYVVVVVALNDHVRPLLVHEGRRRRRHVGDRREVEVDPEAGQGDTGALPLVERDGRAAGGDHLRRRERRRRPGNALDRAAFLVGRDEEPWLSAGGGGGAELRREGRDLRRGRDVGAEEDHAADLAAPDPTEEVGARGSCRPLKP